MAVQQSRESTPNAPLTGTVRTIGPRPRISPGERVATVADLRIRVTGGKRGSHVIAKFTVTLNTGLASVGTARLIDETAGSRAVLATKSRRSYVFESVAFPAPGPNAFRIIRITNVRANANAIGVSSAQIPTPVMARVKVSGSTPVRLSNADQIVASVSVGRRKAARRRTAR